MKRHSLHQSSRHLCRLQQVRCIYVTSESRYRSLADNLLDSYPKQDRRFPFMWNAGSEISKSFVKEPEPLNQYHLSSRREKRRKGKESRIPGARSLLKESIHVQRYIAPSIVKQEEVNVSSSRCEGGERKDSKLKPVLWLAISLQNLNLQ